MNHLEKVGAMLCNKRLQLGILNFTSRLAEKLSIVQFVMQRYVTRMYVYKIICLTCVRFYSGVCTVVVCQYVNVKHLSKHQHTIRDWRLRDNIFNTIPFTSFSNFYLKVFEIIPTLHCQ
jgi:hypothetical protein